MKVDLNAQVIARDGEELGSIQRAVFDPGRETITDFVISTGGLFGRDVLLPASEIERASADGERIRLAIGRDEVERLPTYISDNYAWPTAGWVYPGAYGFGAYGGVVWPIEYADPRLYGAGSDPSRPDETAISRGAVVLDRAGDELGVVDEVRFDPAGGQVGGFVLRVGGTLRTLLGGGEAVEISSAMVDRVENEVIHLRIAKEDLQPLIA